MRRAEAFKYANYAHLIDIDAFEAEIGFEPLREGANRDGETEDIGHCPDPWSLHKNGDTTGKFAINRDRRLWNCWVCGGGTLLSLAMAVKDMTDQEAETWLYTLTKPVEQTDEDFLSEIDAILYRERIENPPLPYYNAHALDGWTKNIGELEHWLEGRGISMEVAQKHSLGYKDDALRLAPVKAGKPSEEPYSGPAVIFPHFWGDRLVGWQQRWLDEDRPKWIPKYTNTSGFPKTETIYNYEAVYFAERPIIVVESVPTVLFLESLGYPAVAVFGASIDEEQMRLLRLCQQGLVLAPDNDGPGRKWIGYSESEQLALKRGKKIDRIVLADYLTRYLPVKIIDPVGEYDSGADLADLIDEGLPFAREAVGLLYEEARYYA